MANMEGFYRVLNMASLNNTANDILCQSVLLQYLFFFLSVISIMPCSLLNHNCVLLFVSLPF